VAHRAFSQPGPWRHAAVARLARTLGVANRVIIVPRFIDFYDQEQYLFETVGPRFREQKFLAAFDFFCIVIWKANRAKSKIATRLINKNNGTLEQAVEQLTREIAQAVRDQDRLEVLMSGWGIRLPMASAILTVLYPNQFTIYDVRVCEVLDDFRSPGNTTHPARCWEGYRTYVKAVQRAVIEPLSLRDKDRWLWGQSFALQLQRDIRQGFHQASPAQSDA
jgi:hypothetical protein